MQTMGLSHCLALPACPARCRPTSATLRWHGKVGTCPYGLEVFSQHLERRAPYDMRTLVSCADTGKVHHLLNTRSFENILGTYT